jgi:hypothetical protein
MSVASNWGTTEIVRGIRTASTDTPIIVQDNTGLPFAGNDEACRLNLLYSRGNVTLAVAYPSVPRFFAMGESDALFNER